MVEKSVVLQLDRSAYIKALNLTIKVALFASFFVAIVFAPDTVANKAMPYRALIFLPPAIIFPILAKRRSWDSYPHTADALLAAPFLLDTLANLLGFYDRVSTTDDVLHAINWILLVGAFHAFRFRTVQHSRDAVLLGYGFGGLAIIWWEVFEWVVSADGWFDQVGLELTYSDTVGDLLLSSTGGLVGSVLAVWIFKPGFKAEGDFQTTNSKSSNKGYL